ncbi:tyrosine-type recombinase/integrase [Methanobacterium aggregans]|uniref:tyrosine-type recombinase/integrase n=1 Tax=Methanobacterium aggregans TaxID=1615586 RepID=UPI001AE2DBA1|nr:tyrosine-type recombinase/integrase [Methanobacterium aggregans]MBP2045142.1 integrase [Methanobacterium aggregans]
MNPEDEELIEQWFLRRNISSGTQKSYLIAIKSFSELMDKTPSELIDEAETEEDAGIRPRKRKLYSHLLKYKKHLEEKVASSTVNLYFSAIKSFYKAFDITLPEIKMDKGDIGLEKNIGKPLTRDDIRKLIGAASIRERALIYLMVMSGMGQNEARNLSIKKFLTSASVAINKELKNLDDLFQNENEVLKEVITIEIRREKVNYRHHTFIPPEVSREIIGYLKERCYGTNEKIRIKNINEPIFVNKKGKELSRDSVVTNFRRIGQDAGFQKEDGAYAFWRSHALRKFFISTIINKRGEKIIADYMAGHKINDQDRTYWQANPDDLKKKYIQTLPYLSIDEAKVKDVETEEFKTLIADSKKKDKEIDTLERKVDVLESLVDGLIARNELDKPKD